MSEISSLWKQLSQCDWFENLASQTQKCRQLEKIFLQYLDSSFQDQCHVYQFRDGCLYVAVRNGAMAMRLRYLIPRLITDLKKNAIFSSLMQIEYKVMTEEEAPQKKLRETPKLSSQTARLIEENAENIQHPSLRKSLQELAKILKLRTK